MKERNFKFRKSYAEVIRVMDDKQAGRFIKAISDYAFEGKAYGGKDTAVKTAFVFTKQQIDEDKFYREKGKLGGQKIAERKRETEEGNPILKSVIETVIANELLSGMLDKQDEKPSFEKRTH